MRTSMPFCIIDRPYVVWSNDVDQDRIAFLERIDIDFYDRMVQMLVNSLDEKERSEHPVKDNNSAEADQGRRDIASLCRLLWHHGIETLVMMFGAYIQAPSAVHAYFLKCRTEDTLEMARSLLQERCPLNNRINDAPFNIENLINGIHLNVSWPNRKDTILNFSRALHGMLSVFIREEHRWEYNSIKHGLRVSHGRFALAAGIEETPGIEADQSAMQLVGYSRDASFFNVARPLQNASKEDSRVNFKIDKVSVTWSLEKVLCDLQLLSIFIGNTVSALRVAAGAAPGTVQFRRPVDAEEWWQRYEGFYAGAVSRLSFGVEFDAAGIPLPTAADVLASYHQDTWNW